MSALEITLGSGIEVADENHEKSDKPKHLLGRLRDRVQHEIEEKRKPVDPKHVFENYREPTSGGKKKGAYKKPPPKKRSPIKG